MYNGRQLWGNDRAMSEKQSFSNEAQSAKRNHKLTVSYSDVPTACSLCLEDNLSTDMQHNFPVNLTEIYIMEIMETKHGGA